VESSTDNLSWGVVGTYACTTAYVDIAIGLVYNPYYFRVKQNCTIGGVSSYSSVYTYYVPTPTPTPTRTSTPTPTPTISMVGGYYNCGYGCQYYSTPPGCASCTPTGEANIYVDNTSSTLVVSEVYVQPPHTVTGLSTPINPVGSDYGTTIYSGTKTVQLYITGSGVGYMELIDSNFGGQCQNFLGAGYYSFYNVWVDAAQYVQINLKNGSCF
jgi:hypothetical protein